MKWIKNLINNLRVLKRLYCLEKGLESAKETFSWVGDRAADAIDIASRAQRANADTKAIQQDIENELHDAFLDLKRKADLLEAKVAHLDLCLAGLQSSYRKKPVKRTLTRAK